MDPWSVATASLASASVAANALNSAARSLQPLAANFMDYLSNTSESEAVVSAEATVDESAKQHEDSLQSLAAEIQERVAELLGLANLTLPQSSQIELSPLGNVFVDGPVEHQADVESELDSDQGLKGLLEKWYQLSGGQPFEV